MEAEDYDTAKALKQNIERLRLAGEASHSGGRAPGVQQGAHSGRSNGYGHDDPSTRNQVGIDSAYKLLFHTLYCIWTSATKFTPLFAQAPRIYHLGFFDGSES